MKIFIDAGHGGNDSGAIGNPIIEKDFNLLIANKVISKLKDYDCIVLSSRTTDKYVSLDERVELSNKNKCDCFISIHCNSSVNLLSKIIDKLSLNELPQFYNVLIGDMSLIGPRAFICNEKLPEGTISEKRYLVKPGIFGLAQSRGGRYLSYSETLKCDIEYYDNLSFMFDFKILINNIIVIFKQLFK